MLFQDSRLSILNQDHNDVSQLMISFAVFGRQMTSPHVTEAQSSDSLIDPQLRRADWSIDDHTQVSTEIPVAGYDATPSQDVADYCLHRTNGILPC